MGIALENESLLPIVLHRFDDVAAVSEEVLSHTRVLVVEQTKYKRAGCSMRINCDVEFDGAVNGLGDARAVIDDCFASLLLQVRDGEKGSCLCSGRAHDVLCTQGLLLLECVVLNTAAEERAIGDEFHRAAEEVAHAHGLLEEERVDVWRAGAERLHQCCMR